MSLNVQTSSGCPSPYANAPDSPIASAKKPKSYAGKSSLLGKVDSGAMSPNGKPAPKTPTGKPLSKLTEMKNAGGSIVNSFRNALFAPGGRDSRENDDENSESSTSSTHKAGSSSLPAISTPNGQSSSNNQGLSSPVGRVAASSTGMSPQVAKLSVSTSAKSPGKPAVVPMSPPMSPGGKNPKGMQICPPNVVITPTRQQQLPPPDDDDDDDLFNPYQFMHQIPPHAYVKIPNKIVLPPMQEPKHKITLVLDLDETLVHCSVEPIPKPDVIFPVLFNGVNYQVHVRKRPYLDFFLENIAPYYEVVLFTASQKVYADKLCEYIDPKQNMIRHRLFRDSCLCVQGNYIKDIDVLGRDMKSTVLVDNSPYAYSYHHDNGIPIESWYDQDDDQELLKLLGFLKNKLDGCDDVRPIVREQFKTFRLIEESKRGVPMRHLKIEGF